MDKARFETAFEKNGGRILITLSLLLWDGDGIFYVYSPALDLTGYGKSEMDAKKSFEETLTDFVSYTENKKTIYKELTRLGWTVNEKKRRVNAPDIQQLLEDNETFRDLQNMPGVKVEKKELALAL